MLTTELAPAKVNLGLLVGPARADGRHEVVTVFDSVTLMDGLEVVQAPRDEVVCERVQGPNLVADALAALRAAGWDAPPVRVLIHKRIPVAAGMGGGSADAAAMLRLAPRLAAIDGDALAAIAEQLGADVPGQLQPGPSLGTGAGETVVALERLAPYGVLVLPQPFGLATADVYREADRLGLRRTVDELHALRDELSAALGAQSPAAPAQPSAGRVPARGRDAAGGARRGALPPGLLVNDLEPAALSLAPAIGDALLVARAEGADDALVCGSGPTVVGLFWGRDGADRAALAAARLARRHPGALAAEPVGAGLGAGVQNP